MPDQVEQHGQSRPHEGAPPTVPVLPTSRDAALIRDFLAKHSALCPYCRYPLFKLQTDRCPECGGVYALGVVTASHDPRTVPLYLPLACNVPIGLIGALFATFVRGEHDDWQVGISIAVVSAVIAVPLWIWRGAIGSVRPARVLLTVLWTVSAAVGGVSCFLEI